MNPQTHCDSSSPMVLWLSYPTTVSTCLCWPYLTPKGTPESGKSHACLKWPWTFALSFPYVYAVRAERLSVVRKERTRHGDWWRGSILRSPDIANVCIFVFLYGASTPAKPCKFVSVLCVCVLSPIPNSLHHQLKVLYAKRMLPWAHYLAVFAATARTNSEAKPLLSFWTLDRWFSKRCFSLFSFVCCV